VINSNAVKGEVLESLADLLHTKDEVNMVIIHYNGHGSCHIISEMIEESGLWCCANSQKISIEEILKIIDKKAKFQIQ